MTNVSQVGNIPDDEATSNAEAAAQLALQAAQAAEAAQAAAEQARDDTLAALAAQELGDHADTTFAALANGDYITWNGSIWVNGPFNQGLNDLSDADVGTASDGDILQRVAGTWIGVDADTGLPYLPLAGGTLTGSLTLDADPTTALEAATKAYVDNAVGGVTPYDIAVFFDGVPVADEDVLKFVAVRDYYLPEDLVGSRAVSTVSATAQTDLDIQKNGSSIGTIRWAAAATSATFIFAADVNFVAGDVLRIVAPTTPDATLEDIAITLDSNLGSIA